MAGAPSGDAALGRICEDVRRTLGFRRALVARLDEERDTVHAVVLQGLEWPGDEWLPLERFPLLLRARAAGAAVFVRDARGSGDVPPRIVERFGLVSIAATPLALGERCLGFVIADWAGERSELGGDELRLLTALGWLGAAFLERADRADELRRALEEVRRAEQAKSDFVSVASHELRTPIAVVHGLASTLHARGAELAPEQVAELHATLAAYTTRLGALTEQLLDLSRLEAGAVSLHVEPVRPRELVESLLPRIAPERLDDVEVALEEGLELATDPAALERVVANLVGNALRYGRPPVRVAAAASADGVRLVVEDRGDGIPPELRERVFERFARGRRGGDGAGLGLAIARSYAEALGGELAYEDAQPQGARFTLTLPAG